MPKYEIQIIDLPLGHVTWLYAPFRPTEFRVRPQGALVFSTIRCTAVEPLTLKVGDTVQFASETEVPESLLDLTRDFTGHPVYAVLTQKGNTDAKASSEQSAAEPVFVGRSDR